MRTSSFAPIAATIATSSTPGHPRTRGHDGAAEETLGMGEWHPRTRGLDHAARDEEALLGTIRARADCTAGSSAREPTCPDHPRSRWLRVPTGAGLGQSAALPRTIRAHAGCTGTMMSCVRAYSVHPRSRAGCTHLRCRGAVHVRWSIRARAGCTASPHLRAIAAVGPSALARAALVPVAAQRALVRSIRARAGCTSYCFHAGSPLAVHPRSRGLHVHAREFQVLAKRSIRARAGCT